MRGRFPQRFPARQEENNPVVFQLPAGQSQLSSRRQEADVELFTLQREQGGLGVPEDAPLAAGTDTSTSSCCQNLRKRSKAVGPGMPYIPAGPTPAVPSPLLPSWAKPSCPPSG